MDLPKTNQIPDDPEDLPPARRRRVSRQLTPIISADHTSFLDDFALRVTPSFDLFLFSLIAVLTISAGFLVDSPALLVLGSLLAPTMTPVAGLALGMVTGSARFFARSLASLLIVLLLVLLISTLAGYFASFLEAAALIQIYYHAQLIWHNLLVLVIGAVLTTYSLVKMKRRSVVAGVALNFELFLPLAVAGFGLGSGIPHLWPDGLVVFTIHLALASLISAATLVLLGFRPLTLFGFTLGGVAVLFAVVILLGLSGVGAAFLGEVAIPTPIPTETSTPTATLPPSPTATLTDTPLPPTATLPPSLTPSITPSPSPSLTPSPTPVYALVRVPEDLKGALLRATPGFDGEIIASALNGTLVEILGDVPVEADSTLWLQVRLPDGREGWMLQSALLAATPAPNW
jgi:hypothetical protein